MKRKLSIHRNCDNFDSLPNITISIPSRDYYDENQTRNFDVVLTPRDFIIDGLKIKSRQNLLRGDEQECNAAFMAIDVPSPRGPIFVFGEYFLKKFYTVFDRDNKIIGISQIKDELDETKENIVTPYDDTDDGKMSEYEKFGASLTSKSFLKQNLNLDLKLN